MTLNDRHDNRGAWPSDYLTTLDLDGLLAPETITLLARHTDLVALDGTPCVEADRVEDLVRMLEGGGP